MIKAAPDGGMIVTGNGSPTRPYLLSQEDATNPLGNLTVSDDPGGTLDLTISGAGTTVDKRIITGRATQALTGLKDVQGTPSEGKVLVWRTDHWAYETPAAGGGTGLPPGGTDGQVLTKQSSVNGDALWESLPAAGGGGTVLEPPIIASYQRLAALTGIVAATTLVWDTPKTPAAGIGYNSSTGIFAVQTTGWYLITVRLRVVAASTLGYQLRLIDGAGGFIDFMADVATPSQSAASLSKQVYLTAGSTFFAQMTGTGAGVDLSTTGNGANGIEVTRLDQGVAPGGGGVVVERPQASRRKHAAATAILHATITAIPWDTLDYEDGIAWSAPDAAWIAPSDGYYDVEAAVTFAANATGTRVIYCYLDSLAQGSFSSSGSEGAAKIATTVKALAGQKINIRVQQTSGATLALNGNLGYNVASITKVPAAYAGSAVSTYGEQNYAASGRNISAQSIPNNASTAVVLDSIDFADGITWDGATNEFVVSVAGYYQVNAKVNFAANTAGYRQMRVLVNAASAVGGIFNDNAPSAAVSGYAALGYSRTYKLAAGDRVQLQAYQNSGAALALASQYTSLDITKVPAPVVNGAAASGVWGVGNLAGLGSDSLVGREVYIDSKGQLRTAPLPASLSNLGVWVDCTAEVRFCTDASSTANPGQSITYARYMKIGKTVWYSGRGVIGSGVVVNFALLIPPSAGVAAMFNGASQTGTPQAKIGGGDAIEGGYIIAADRLINYLGSSTAYSDSVANQQYRWSIVYEVV